MPENGVLQSISFHIEGGSGNVQLGVYADNNGIPGDRIGQTLITRVRSTRGWQTISLENPVSITSGSTIWLAWIFSNNPGIAYISGTPGRYQANGSSWSTNGGNMPSNYGNGSQSNFRYSIYANYTRSSSTTEYILAINTTGEGAVTGGGSYEEGSSVTVTAAPAAGWQFDGWSGDLSGTTNPASINMNTNKDVTAIFSEVTGGGETRTIEVAITDGNDDVEESQSGTLYANSSDLEMVYDSFNNNGYQKIGLRFRSIDIPKNATINSAYIQFTADESNSDGATLEIALHDSSNSPAFSSSNNVSARATFSNKILWNPQSWSRDQNGNSQRSPNLKTMIQSLVSKNGWISGNNLSFIITGKGTSLTNTSAKRVADSYEGGADKAARLVVEYTSDGTRSSTTTNQMTYKDFRIHPNPFGDEFNISTSGLKTDESFRVVIHTLGGKVIYKEDFKTNSNNGTVTIQPLHFDSGIYLLLIRDKNGKIVKTQRLLKE